MPPRQRADRLLVERGLVESRAKAQAADPAAGLGFHRRRRAGAPRPPTRSPTTRHSRSDGQEHPWVSRGGLKLRPHRFEEDPRPVTGGRIGLDVGASTGGLPMSCWRGARRWFTRSTWAMGSWPGNCGPIRAWWCISGPMRGIWRRRYRRSDRRAGLRREFHRSRHAAAGAVGAVRARRLGGRADQAAIRGAARREQEGHCAQRGGSPARLRGHAKLRRLARSRAHHAVRVRDHRRRWYRRILLGRPSWLSA